VATYVGGVALLTRLAPFSSSVGVAATTLAVAADLLAVAAGAVEPVTVSLWVAG
jgi:hypothetical protein